MRMRLRDRDSVPTHMRDFERRVAQPEAHRFPWNQIQARRIVFLGTRQNDLAANTNAQDGSAALEGFSQGRIEIPLFEHVHCSACCAYAGKDDFSGPPNYFRVRANLVFDAEMIQRAFDRRKVAGFVINDRDHR